MQLTHQALTAHDAAQAGSSGRFASPFGRVKYKGRSQGHDWKSLSAYPTVTSDGEERPDLLYAELMLPADAPLEFRDWPVFGDRLELSEKRVDAQLVKEIILAIPSFDDFPERDQIEIVKLFVQRAFVDKGLGALVCLHRASNLDPDSAAERKKEEALPTLLKMGDKKGNVHAHVLVTLRRIDRNGFSRKKARDLEPPVRWHGNGGVYLPITGELLRQWRDAIVDYGRAEGQPIHVDLPAIRPGVHLGPAGYHKGSAKLRDAIIARGEGIRAAHDPGEVLKKLTSHNATFTREDMERFVHKQLGGVMDGDELAAKCDEVMASPDVAPLFDRSGEPARRYTWRPVLETEKAIRDLGGALATRRIVATAADEARRLSRLDKIAQRMTLTGEQRTFLEATLDGRRLTILDAVAGTGKSHAIAAGRALHADKKVIGLAFTNEVVQDMRKSGFSEAMSGTIHAALQTAPTSDDGGDLRGRSPTPDAAARKPKPVAEWDRNTVVFIDESSMISAPLMRGLLEKADRSGAQLILVGDPNQLPSIDHPGMFRDLVERHDHCVRRLTGVVRQRLDWQKLATGELSQYKFADALKRFGEARYRRGTGSEEEQRQERAIVWSKTVNEATDDLMSRWARETAEEPAKKRLIFAYTNQHVDELNDRCSDVLWKLGRLEGPRVAIPWTSRNDRGARRSGEGPLYASGDRIQFTKTDGDLGVCNGELAKIISIDPKTLEIRAEIDGTNDAEAKGDEKNKRVQPHEKKRIVTWNANVFDGFKLGYAGTIYKGQGKTVDHTYLLHTAHWTSAASYVALTRHRVDATIFVARNVAKDEKALAAQMSRHDTRRPATDFLEEDEARALRSAATATDRSAARDDRRALIEKVRSMEPRPLEEDRGVFADPRSLRRLRSAAIAGILRFERDAGIDPERGDREKEAELLAATALLEVRHPEDCLRLYAKAAGPSPETVRTDDLFPTFQSLRNDQRSRDGHPIQPSRR